MSRSRYSKLYQEKLFEKYTAVGVVGAPTFTFAFASHLYESVGILSQRIEEINIFVTWFNWYVRFLFSFIPFNFLFVYSLFACLSRL